MGKTKTKSRSFGDSPKPPITIRSTNVKILDDNIAKLEKVIQASDVSANPSGTAEETLLSTIGIDGKKYELGPSAKNTSYDNTDSGSTAEDVQAAIDELVENIEDVETNNAYNVYHYNGVIINGTSPSTISGEGSATIELFKGIAKITFEAIIKTADAAENFAYGINRDLFTTITGKTITPTDKGILFYYTSGAIDSSLMDNCGIPDILNNEGIYWRPARAFTGGSGGWGSTAFAQNTRISGTIYGTYTI